MSFDRRTRSDPVAQFAGDESRARELQPNDVDPARRQDRLHDAADLERVCARGEHEVEADQYEQRDVERDRRLSLLAHPRCVVPVARLLVQGKVFFDGLAKHVLEALGRDLLRRAELGDERAILRFVERGVDALVRARLQGGDHGGGVLLAHIQGGIPALVDVDGAAQGTPAAGSHPVGDLVAAEPCGQCLGTGEDQGEGRVVAHVPTVTGQESVCGLSTGRSRPLTALAQLRPLATASSRSENGLS